MKHTNDGKISLNDFLHALHRHQEIEFSLAGQKYFAAPKADPPLQTIYGILNVDTRGWIFEGTVEELLLLEFSNQKTLGSHFNDFCIEYIL